MRRATKLADGATPVAVRAENTTQHVVFTFETGDELTSGTTPAPRVVAGLSEPTLAHLTADGEQLVVNLLTWAAEGDAPLRSAVVAATAPTHCGEFTGVVACYEMNDTSSTMTDSAGNSNLTSATGGTTKIRRVKRDGLFAEYFFNGWKDSYITDTSSSNYGGLDPTKSLATTESQAVIDKKNVTNAHSFNPGVDPWRIALRIKPYLVKVSPTSTAKELPKPAACGGCSAADPSYNLVQKGRNGVPGGFYKIEIIGHDDTNGAVDFVKGSVHCVFQDSDGTLVEAYSGMGSVAANRVTIRKSKYYDISCLRSGDSVTLRVKELNNGPTPPTDTTTVTAPAGTLGNVSPENATPAANTWSPLFGIGKKPSSTQIEESFTGWIDYVVLATQ